MAIIDLYNHSESYRKWKEEGALIKGISSFNADLIRRYIFDMEEGINVSPQAKKGSRSYGRLRNLKFKIVTLTKLFEENYDNIMLSDLTDEIIISFFNKMRKGIFKSKWSNKPYKATGTYVKIFKAFWHWYMRVKRKEGKDIQDITIDLDATDDKPKFHYFTFEQFKKLTRRAKYEYRVLMYFLYDSGIRAPTELMNVQVKDLEWDKVKGFYNLTIKEESSKTFGRKIKLLLCSEILKDYIKDKGLKDKDHIWTITPQKTNLYLSRLGNKYLGFGKPREIKYKIKKTSDILVTDGLSMYDFRHSSACYWLPRYKSESALKYRFGWKKGDMIHYYTEFLGMKDTISQDDLIDADEKTMLQKELETNKQRIEVMQEENDSIRKELEKINKQMQYVMFAKEKKTAIRNSMKNPSNIDIDELMSILKKMKG